MYTRHVFQQPRGRRVGLGAVRVKLSTVLLLLALAACGGGGGGGVDPGNSPAPAAQPAAPSAPSGLAAAVASTTTVNLAWADNSDNETGFKIERATDAGGPYAQIAVSAAGITHHADTGLAAATAYHYRLRATNAQGDSAYTNVASTTTEAPAPVPAAPTGLVATAVTPDSITLAWTDHASNEAGFSVERATAADGPYAEIAAPLADVPGHTDTGLQPQSTYHYRVRATHANGPSAYSNTLSASTSAAPSIPAAPSAPRAAALSATGIALSWTDNSDDEAGFRIQRAPAAGGPYSALTTTAMNVVSFIDTGRSPSTTYHYRVQATNAAGDSAWTAVFSATTQAPAVVLPAAPSGLTATAQSATRIRLSWVDNSNNETGFQIERAPAADGPYTLLAATTANAFSHDDDALSAATRYHYRVRAVSSAGTSGYTASAAATTLAPPVTVPAAPSALVATATSATSITLSWADNANNETGFQVERATSAGGPFSPVASVAAGAVGSIDATVSPATTYHYRVSAFNSAGPSPYTAVATATTPAASGTVTLAPMQDNLVMSSSLVPATAGQAFASGELAVGCNWSYSSITGQAFVCAQSLIKFNLSALAGKTIDSATLTLVTKYTGVGSFPRTWHIWAPSSPWNAGVTWNGVATLIPYPGSTLAGLSPPNAATPVYAINLKNIVQAWTNGTWVNHGLAMEVDNYGFPFATSFDAFAFYSQEAAANLRPSLTVQYR